MVRLRLHKVGKARDVHASGELAQFLLAKLLCFSYCVICRGNNKVLEHGDFLGVYDCFFNGY